MPHIMPECRNCSDDGYFYTHSLYTMNHKNADGENLYNVGICDHCKAGDNARRALKLMGVRRSDDIGLNLKEARTEEGNGITFVYYMTRKQLDMLERMNVERETN